MRFACELACGWPSDAVALSDRAAWRGIISPRAVRAGGVRRFRLSRPRAERCHLRELAARRRQQPRAHDVMLLRRV